jgi:hypothetical protein
MSADSSRAVFLSYASQGAEAARRFCEALRAAGVEVWFACCARRFEFGVLGLESGNPQSAIRNRQ